ncbi:MAG: TetR/AcrR family transcriptional regulator [Acidimicrobiales bacterium]|nr:TetR/AcrR family transcriptional regulator [Acidimicrobiales bacterium]
MAEKRRRRAATVEKVEQVLDATERIMLDEGYAAVSSRSVAGKVGINPPMVHYYVGSIDDLFVAVLRRRAEGIAAQLADALESDEPLRSWWQLAADPRGSALFIEFIAASNHRPALGKVLGEYAREVRKLQMERLEELLPLYGLDPIEFPPALVAAATQGLAFGLVADELGGHDTATAEARAAMDRLIDRLEARRKASTD